MTRHSRNIVLYLLLISSGQFAHAQVENMIARHIGWGSSLPATCSPSTGDVFFKTASTVGLYSCTAANTWTLSSGGLSGSGTSGQVALWTGTSSLGGDSDLTFSTDTLTATKVNAPTSITSPLAIGGSAVGSSLTLKSTSGAGTTDFINFLVGNDGGTESMRILTSGRIVIGTTTALASALLSLSYADAANRGIVIKTDVDTASDVFYTQVPAGVGLRIQTVGASGSKFIGGNQTTSALTYQTTTGAGTTGADHIFLVGTNGGTTAVTIQNAGTVIIPNLAAASGEVTICATTTGLLVKRNAACVGTP